MPYLICPDCGLETRSAALRSTPLPARRLSRTAAQRAPVLPASPDAAR